MEGDKSVIQSFEPYCGTALIHLDAVGTILFGAPADSFKAVKATCQNKGLPFPRILIAPKLLMTNAVAQFAPEFFLYDFLFVYGAAFKPELAEQKLTIIAPKAYHESIHAALTHTLLGPSLSELQQYAKQCPEAGLDAATIERLHRQSEHLAIKRNGRVRQVEDMVTFATLQQGAIRLSDTIEVTHDEEGFAIVMDGRRQYVHIPIFPKVEPFASLAAPTSVEPPQAFGIHALGTRSGFDLSGPTTGFALYVSGRILLFDGPPALCRLLETQGFSLRDVEGAIVSHCHEDHMPSIIELILRGDSPKIYTAEPIYRSLLVKLSNYFRQPQHVVAGLLRYERVVPDKPIWFLGATLRFFYTAHSIPTLGVNASYLAGGRVHQIQISGDTLHHRGIDEMAQLGILPSKQHSELRSLIPNCEVPHALYLADVGGPPIHGEPKDWAGNPNRIMYYHCPDNDVTRSFGHCVINPGDRHVMHASPQHSLEVPTTLKEALVFLSLDDTRWLNVLLHLGEVVTIPIGGSIAEVLGTEHKSGVLLSGVLQAPASGTLHGEDTLRVGDVFGPLFAYGNQAAFWRVTSPTRIFVWSAETLEKCIEAQHSLVQASRQREHRPAVNRRRLFRSVNGASLNELCAASRLCSVADLDTQAPQGGAGSNLYVVRSGGWVIWQQDWPQRVNVPSADFSFFNEARVLLGSLAPPLQVSAITSTAECMSIPADMVRGLAARFADLKLDLQRAYEARRGRADVLSDNA